MTPLERVHDALRAAGSEPDRSGRHWRCPVEGHGLGQGDRHPSLALDEGQDGRVLVHCEAGCSTEAVVGALGLRMTDLFPGRGESARTSRREGAHPHTPRNSRANPETSGVRPRGAQARTRGHTPDCTLRGYAETKRLPEDYLRRLGIREQPYQGGVALRIPYLDEGGEEAAVRYRLRIDGDSDAPRFRWRTGSKPLPYGLHRLCNAQATGAVVLVEGESDVHTLWHHGVPALGVPGATTWRPEWAGALEGISTVFAVREPDQGGTALVRRLAEGGLAERLRIVELDGAKDVSELHCQDPERFPERFASALDASTTYTEERRAESEAEADAAYQRCERLAAEPDIFARLVETLRHRGVVGEERLAKLTYLAVTSRLLERPVSLAAKGLSSAGKSYTTRAVLGLCPPSAYYSVTAMSERALAYSDEPLAHRMIVLAEAAGMESDFGSYLLRSLLSEGCVRYETVEATQEGVRARLIERPGPTGAIITTTRLTLHPENETRLLSVPVDDSEAQTRRVLEALAEERGEDEAVTDEWHALQEWLAGAERRVAVPYAADLVRRIPPVAVRLRRDVGALLSLVRAHALLHRATRERDEEGRIVATVGDYAAVRGLVADLLGEGVQAAVPAAVRETVQAAASLLAEGADHVTVADLARALDLERSRASRRAADAAKRGYLARADSGRRGVPAHYVVGDPLPEDQPLLPEPEELAGDGPEPPEPEGVRPCAEGVREGPHTSSARNQKGNGDGVRVCASDGEGRDHTQEPPPPEDEDAPPWATEEWEEGTL